MTQELRDPLEPVRWRRPLFATLGGLAVVLALSLGIPAARQVAIEVQLWAAVAD